jgi:signal transduction histidine kinase
METPNSATILNVDDFEPGRYARSRVLKQAGFHVLEAGTGEEALAIVRERRPLVVILDINLPDISGLEVCRQIKTDGSVASTLVLQLSASAVEAKDWVLALETGADAYLIDPVDPAVLLATIRALLRIAAAERALQKANADLQRSNDELARFAHLASHDLQEPLRTITSYTQLLVRRYGGQMGPEADQFIEFISESATRMRALIRDLLLYSQVDAAAREMVTVDLNVIMRETLRSLETAICETEAEITYDDLPSVRGDAQQIGLLLQNLISNAIKYRSTERPQIVVSAARRGEKWLIGIKDNGIGFSQKYAEHIFETFKRLDRNRSSGTGVGLAIARRVVENHGGEIWAESKPESGSTFWLTLRADGATSVS